VDDRQTLDLLLQPHESSSETISLRTSSASSSALQPHESSSETTTPVKPCRCRSHFNLTRVRLKRATSRSSASSVDFNLTRVRLKRCRRCWRGSNSRDFNLTRVRLKPSSRFSRRSVQLSLQPHESSSETPDRRGTPRAACHFNLTRVRLKLFATHPTGRASHFNLTRVRLKLDLMEPGTDDPRTSTSREFV